jgi:hypothetical protein
MKRNLKLAFLAVAALGLPACLGGYQPGQDPTPPQQQPPANNGGGGGGGGGGAAGGGGGGGGSMTGGPDGGTPGGTANAKAMFDSTVSSMILMRCGASACHGGTGTTPTKFAAGTATTEYDTIIGYTSRVLGDFDKTQATIITKITAGGHNGQTYSAADIKTIGDWLDAEKSIRTSTGTGTTSPRELLLEKFSGCMVKTEWDTAGVATAWAQKTTDTTNTACQQCHVNGQGFFANADSTRMFNVLTTAKNPAGGWFLEMYFTTDQTDPANPKMIINRDLITRASIGTAQHEKFQVDTDRNGTNPPAMTRLTNFFNQTMAHLTANTCGPSRLGTTPPP